MRPPGGELHNDRAFAVVFASVRWRGIAVVAFLRDLHQAVTTSRRLACAGIAPPTAGDAGHRDKIWPADLKGIGIAERVPGLLIRTPRNNVGAATARAVATLVHIAGQAHRPHAIAADQDLRLVDSGASEHSRRGASATGRCKYWRRRKRRSATC